MARRGRERPLGSASATPLLALGTKRVVDDVSDNAGVSENPVRDLLRQRVLEHADEIAELIPEFRYSISTKIPPGDRDEIIRRRRAGESRKSIARDYSCSAETVSRAIRSRLHELGQYDPEAFLSEQRRRRAEGREWMRAIWDARDAKERKLSLAAQEDRERAVEYQGRLVDAEREERRLRAQIFRERQKVKALREQGLPY